MAPKQVQGSEFQLLRISIEQLFEIGRVPGSEPAAEPNGVPVLGYTGQIEREVADDRNVLGPKAFAEPGLVVSEGDVERLMQAALYSPVPSDRSAWNRTADGCRVMRPRS